MFYKKQFKITRLSSLFSLSLSLFLLTQSFLLLSQAIIENVRDHHESLDSLESAVSDVLTLVSEEDQKELSHQLGEVTWRYNQLVFDSSCYPVNRWLEDRSSQLSAMAPSGVLVVSLQVNKFHQLPYMVDGIISSAEVCVVNGMCYREVGWWLIVSKRATPTSRDWLWLLHRGRRLVLNT